MSMLNYQHGEINKFNLSNKRIDNTNSLLQSIKKLRALINTNVTDASLVHFCTLTYKANMTDLKQLYYDFDRFIKKLKYNALKLKYGAFKYIAVPEPQGRGAWHLHILLIWEEKRPFIENTYFSSLWGKGFVNIKALENVSNVGAYLSAYLTNLPREEAEEEDLKNNNKKYIKGARLNLYPVGMNLYRASRGLKKPIEYFSIYKKIDKSKLGAKTYQNTIKITTTDFTNQISKEYYNDLL